MNKQYIVKQGISVYTHAHVWGADAPMVFFDRAAAAEIAERARVNGYHSTKVEAYDEPYEAWQLAGFRAAAKAVKDYGGEIGQDGSLVLGSVNGGPELLFTWDEGQVRREHLGTEDVQILTPQEVAYQFEQDTPVSRWLHLLYGVDPLRGIQ